MADYSAIFKGSAKLELAYEIVELGNLFLPSGRVRCCDPFLSHEVGPLDERVPRGEAAVTLCLVELPDWGKRVALAGLRLSATAPTRWTAASYRAGGAALSEYRVDAGLACFMDEETAELFARVFAEFYRTNPNGNYYDDVLAREFERSADRSRPSGDWNLHYPVENDRRNIAMFASGLGDGVYPSFWGLDDDERPSMLVTDFGLLEPD
jgi:hypothetical protein